MVFRANLPLRRVFTFIAFTFVVALTWLVIFSPDSHTHPLARVKRHHVRFHGRQDTVSPQNTSISQSQTSITVFNTTSSEIISTTSTTSLSSSTFVSSAISSSESVTSTTSTRTSSTTLITTRVSTNSRTSTITTTTSSRTSAITSISVSASSSSSSKSTAIDETPSIVFTISEPTLSAPGSSAMVVISTSITTSDPTPSTPLKSVAAKSKGFWENTTAVAATFVFAGLIVVGMVLAIIVTLLKRCRMRRIQHLHANLFETYESEPTMRRSNSIGPSINAAPLDAFNARENFHIGGSRMLYSFSEQGSSGHAASQGQYNTSNNGHTQYEDSLSEFHSSNYLGDGASSRETYTTPHPFSVAAMTSRDAPPVTYPRAPAGRTNQTHIPENYDSSLFDSFYGGAEHAP